MLTKQTRTTWTTLISPVDLHRVQGLERHSKRQPKSVTKLTYHPHPPTPLYKLCTKLISCLPLPPLRTLLKRKLHSIICHPAFDCEMLLGWDEEDGKKVGNQVCVVAARWVPTCRRPGYKFPYIPSFSSLFINYSPFVYIEISFASCL